VKRAGFCIGKNALFYRTLNGAQVGDLFMSLIPHLPSYSRALLSTTLVELQRHARTRRLSRRMDARVELSARLWHGL